MLNVKVPLILSCNAWQNGHWNLKIYANYIYSEKKQNFKSIKKRRYKLS